MPRNEEENQRIRDAQRTRILHGARKVIVRKGWAATLTDLTVEAKISQGLPYRYFSSKEEIFGEVVEQMIQSNANLLNKIVTLSGTPLEKLTRVVLNLFDNTSQWVEFYEVRVALDNDATPLNIRLQLQTQGRDFRNMLTALVREGQVSGEIAQGKPEQLVTVLMSCLSGLSSLAVRNPDEFQRVAPDPYIITRLLKP